MDITFWRLSEYSQLEQVMAALRTAGSQVLEMQVLQPDLEEVFVKIMGESRRSKASYSRIKPLPFI